MKAHPDEESDEQSDEQSDGQSDEQTILWPTCIATNKYLVPGHNKLSNDCPTMVERFSGDDSRQ